MDIVSCKWREDRLFSDAEGRSKIVDLRALQITVVCDNLVINKITTSHYAVWRQSYVFYIRNKF